jgi:hypothetical protein
VDRLPHRRRTEAVEQHHVAALDARSHMPDDLCGAAGLPYMYGYRGTWSRASEGYITRCAVVVYKPNEALQETRGRACFQAPLYVEVPGGSPAVVSPRAPELKRWAASDKFVPA